MGIYWIIEKEVNSLQTMEALKIELENLIFLLKLYENNSILSIVNKKYVKYSLKISNFYKT